MASRSLMIVNDKGLHVRAATKLAQVASRYDATITVGRGEEVVDGRSIMKLLLLTAAKGVTIVVAADGQDATEALDAIATLVQAGFNE